MRKATDAQLLDSYTRLGNIWKVAEEFGMCGQSVWERLKKLGIKDQDKWTETQLQLLKLAYAVNPTEPINLKDLAKLIGKNHTNVCRKARELGLTSKHRKKTEEICQAISIRTKKHIAEHGHPRGAYKTGKEIRTCSRCGKFFEVFPKSPQQYCGLKCGRNHKQSEAHQGYSKSGKRVDLGGQYFRSRWEANYARYLNFLKEHGEPILKWEFEPETFEFHKIKKGTRFYTPDFKVTYTDGHIEYHEVKGWDYPKGKTARKRFLKYYPKLTLVLIDKEFFKAITAQGTDRIITGWEYTQ
jgi:hypothetical protein